MVIILCRQDCPHHESDHHASRADKQDWPAPPFIDKEAEDKIGGEIERGQVSLDQQLLVRVFDSDTIHEEVQIIRYQAIT